MIKRYYMWRELTDDGLLKVPPKVGPYYDEDDINGYNWRGFETEEEAMTAFDNFHKNHEYHGLDNLVLITTYRNETDT